MTHVTKVTNEATPALSGFAAVASQSVTPGTLSVIMSQAVTPAEVADVTKRDVTLRDRLRAWLIRVLYRVFWLTITCDGAGMRNETELAAVDAPASLRDLLAENPLAGMVGDQPPRPVPRRVPVPGRAAAASRIRDQIPAETRVTSGTQRR